MQPKPSLLVMDGFGAGGFRLSGDWHEGSVLVLEDGVDIWKGSDLDPAGLDQLMALLDRDRSRIDMVLLGVGASLRMPSAALASALRARHLGLDFMTTESACRMHNILANDGRRLLTALVAI